MTFQTLIRCSLRFHWRLHLGVVLGAAIGSAALIGALVVGDSVRGSLLYAASQRVGRIEVALDLGDRLVSTSSLFGFFHVGGYTNSITNSAFRAGSLQQNAAFYLLRSSATISRGDGAARGNRVNVLGIHSSNFYDMLGGQNRFGFLDCPPGTANVNATLAQQLNLQPGDEIILRLLKPAGLSRDAIGSPQGNVVASVRLKVHAIVRASEFGNFNLHQSPSPAMNLFMDRDELNRALSLESKANLLLGGAFQYQHTPRVVSWLSSLGSPGESVMRRFNLIGNGHYRLIPLPASETARTLNSLIPQRMVFEAGGLSFVVLDKRGFELRTSRVFLDEPVARAVLGAESEARPILTYLATLLSAGTNSTPYSMVTAAGSPWTPTDMRDDEILLSHWLAEDLQVKPGDEIAMSYFLPESGAKLEEATNTFSVRAIVPMVLPWADRTLMPDFPGIEKAESTSEWDAGFPLTYKVRPKDDDYWKQHRGTPKAFITLAAGQKMWGNRFGNLTAIRFPIPTDAKTTLTPALSPGERENLSPHSRETETGARSAGSVESKTAQRLSPLPGGEGQGEGERHTQTNQFEGSHVVSYEEALEKKILANLKPEELGLRFEPVREQALKAAAESQDFGGLFLGFSFFVIGAALLLMALLFSLGLEQRAPEIGTLFALGFTPKQVRSLLLREGVALAFLGGVIGALCGLAYAKAMLHGLTTIWRDAVGASVLSFHFTTQSLVIGMFASVVVSVVTIWLTLRKFVKRPARELLVGEIGTTESKVQSLKSKVIAVGALLAGVGLVGWAVVNGDTANAGIFFGAGALVLVTGLGFVNSWFDQVARPQLLGELGAAASPLTLSKLAVRGCARRRKRSLGTVAMLACGSFLIVSIGVFRLDANRDATKRSSGTGGFALIGETTMPVVQDLNSKSGREFFALNESELAGVNFVPFRVREGDEASCLNLNRAQRPRLLGVKPEILEGRFAFAKLADGAWQGKPWLALKRGEFYPKHGKPLALDEMAAIGDANSIQWAMGKKVGDTIDYVDERGQPFKVRIVGAVANSILQGQLIIDEAEFLKRFPGESGSRMFLVDAPSNAVPQVSATLSRALQDVGLELTPAVQRLAQFNAVQNTYLGTFQVLGGLGLLLGSVGLGIVVLRNVLERRGELAVMLAVGFRRRTLQRLLLIENGTLLVVGLALGMIAAAVAVAPALFSASAQLPYASLALTLAAVLVNGALWTWAATRLALRGDLLAALRNE